MEIITQILIPILSCGSIFFFSSGKMKAGFICGLLAQPFWFISTYTNSQWGIFLTCFWYTGMNIRGLWRIRNESLRLKNPS